MTSFTWSQEGACSRVLRLILLAIVASAVVSSSSVTLTLATDTATSSDTLNSPPSSSSASPSTPSSATPSNPRITPFHISFPDSALELLSRKLELSQLPPAYTDERHATQSQASQQQGADKSASKVPSSDNEWRLGMSMPYLESFLDFWRRSVKRTLSANVTDADTDQSSNSNQDASLHDWRATESRLNQLPHYLFHHPDGQIIHFVHVRSSGPNAIPLLFSHGWPGSFLECEKILPLLVNPPPNQPAFHVICPSIPGYGFSSAPKHAGVGVKKVAEYFGDLMDALDYKQYVAQGGDWGAVINSFLCTARPDNCIGLHLNMCPILPPLNLFGVQPWYRALWASVNTLLDVAMPHLWRMDSVEEARMVESTQEWILDHTGYFHVQTTRPDTLGVALHDSPIGLASWLVEKYRAWSDCQGNLDARFNMSDMLDHIMLYYLTGTSATSMRLYYESTHQPGASSGLGLVSDLATIDVEAPTGFAAFPRELARCPRKWMKYQFNMKHYTLMPRGGHFAAMEEAELLVDDVRSFVQQYVTTTTTRDTETSNTQKQSTEQKRQEESRTEL